MGKTIGGTWRVCARCVLWLMIVVVGLYWFYNSLSFFRHEVGYFDEAIQLLSARLVLEGRCPYLDFYSLYTPLNYYANAAMFRLFGVSATSARILQFILFFVAVASYAAYTRRLVRLSVTKTAVVILVGVFFFINKGYAYPWWNAFVATFLALLFYLCIHACHGACRPYLLAIAGGLAGIAALFKWNFGLCVMGADISGNFVIQFIHSKSSSDKTSARVFCTEMLSFVLPFAICFPGYSLLYGSSAGEVLNQVVGFHLFRSGTCRLTPVHSWLYVYATLLPLLWFGWHVILARRGPRTTVAALVTLMTAVVACIVLINLGERHLLLLNKVTLVVVFFLLVLQAVTRAMERSQFVVCMCYALFLHYLLTRADLFHLLPLLPLAGLLFVHLVRERELRMPCRIHERAPFAAMAGFLLALPLWPDAGMQSNYQFLMRHTVDGARIAIHSVERRGSDQTLIGEDDAPIPAPESLLYRDNDEILTIRYVRDRSAFDSPIYVGAVRHARLYMGFPRIYWLLDRPLPSRYFIGEPGLETAEDVQAQIIEDIEDHRVQWVILGARAPDADFEEHAIEGSHLLDDYIHNAFVPVQHYGIYSIFTRRAGSEHNPVEPATGPVR